jgi:hypothetical protein
MSMLTGYDPGQLGFYGFTDRSDFSYTKSHIVNYREVKSEAVWDILGKNNLTVSLDTNITPELKAEGDARDLIRQIQSLRKEKQLNLKDQIKIFAPTWPVEFEKEILTKTLGVSIEKSENVKISLASNSN